MQTLLDADGRTVVHLSSRGADPDGQGAIRLTGPVGKAELTAARVTSCQD